VEITVTLDGDLVAFLREQARLRRMPLDEVVNEALRRAMSIAIDEAPRRPFRVRPHSGGYAPGIDVRDPKAFKKLLDQDDLEHYLNVQRYGAGDP